jgi:lauroyl/myristoyl acyltransferase
MKAIEQVAQQQKQRITCESTGRLIATVSEQGMTVWCKYQKQAEFISWETLDALRAKCEGVQRPGENRDVC